MYTASALSLPLSLLSLSLSPSLTLSPLSLPLPLSLPRTERARLAEALRFARGHYHSLLGAYGLGAHGFSTERARLAGGTSLRSWFQKKCLLPVGIFIFFPKYPRFRN